MKRRRFARRLIRAYISESVYRLVTQQEISISEIIRSALDLYFTNKFGRVHYEKKLEEIREQLEREKREKNLRRRMIEELLH